MFKQLKNESHYASYIQKMRLDKIYSLLYNGISENTLRLLNLSGAIESGVVFLTPELKQYSYRRTADKGLVPITTELPDINNEYCYFDFIYKKPIFSASNKKDGYVFCLFLKKPSRVMESCCYMISENFSLLLDNILKTIASYQERENLLEALLLSLKVKDTYTYRHSQNVQNNAALIGELIGLDYEQMDLLRVSGLLHDIGKLNISLDILRKPSKLTDDEYDTIKSHPVYTYEYTSSVDLLKPVASFTYHHHERYDGHGYPDGLRGENIPLQARILSIADSFDAMTGSRVYRSPLTMLAAAEEIFRNRNSQFDPHLANIFYEAIKKNFRSSLITQ